MRRTMHLGAFVAAALAAVGCTSWAQANGSAKMIECPPGQGQCNVKVVVTPSGDGCSIDKPDPIHVQKNKKPVLVWTIQNQNGGQFKFMSGGIQFNDKADPIPAGEFTDLGPKANGTQYHVKDNNKVKKPSPGAAAKQFNYKITVVKPNNTPACELDPVVVNDGCDTGC